MESRRDFIKKASALAGGVGMLNVLPMSIQKALAIDPAAGSTYLDAEHVVILMQENRSFDHCYGTLQGVRGFNDRRTVTLPDGDRVWLQKNNNGETYAPFRLNIKDTKSTWTGSLPHSWTDQVDARNDGRHDKWLIAKASGHPDFRQAPLTMGYYNRADIPFYYSLADAFTVCDQNFCSSLTGTTPNRLYLWTGTVKENKNDLARVRNQDLDYDDEARWKTFPERLQDNNISWKIYQNEISLPTGLRGEEESWLANFTDNSIEWFSQFNVRFAPGYVKHLQRLIETIPAEIDELGKIQAKDAEEDAEIKQRIQKAQKVLADAKLNLAKWSKENFEKLSSYEKQLHERAFTTNSGDPNYRQLETLSYQDGNVSREMKVPKGDILYQFRKDVENHQLPAVSWLVAPENFSDHPGAPWYGAWYVSEVMDILTKDPEVWKKTIFILCYDENDGYFDHVPPFVPPDPAVSHSGLVSKSIDSAFEHVTLQDDLKKYDKEDARGSAIGLGYRVPLVIASPWSRGGAVCSQVFDHTSVIQLLEKIFTSKVNKPIREGNISEWRRTVCGDLTSVFRPYNNEKIVLPAFKEKQVFLESVHSAQFKPDPRGYSLLSADEIARINKKPWSVGKMPIQEKGTRASCPLPYELYVHGKLSADKQRFTVDFEAGNKLFGSRSAGCPFTVYAPGKYVSTPGNKPEVCRSWNYAVAAGDKLQDQWTLKNFENKSYHLRVYGPNGFFRDFAGTANDPDVVISLVPELLRKLRATGNLVVKFDHEGDADGLKILIRDNAYGAPDRTVVLGKRSSDKSTLVVLNLDKSFGWYDFTVLIPSAPQFVHQFAGHVETGTVSRTDPAMGEIER